MKIAWPSRPFAAGLSSKPEGFSLAYHTADTMEEKARVQNDRALFLQQEGFDRLVTLKQIHSTRIFEASPSADCWDNPYIEGDAVYTKMPGVLIGVFTADCLPLLISGETENGKPVAAAVHAGWRGLAAGIAEATLDRLLRDTGMNRTTCHIWIGPHIRQCCYEVGEEFRQHFDASCFQGRKLSLETALLSRLKAAGIPKENIRLNPACTRCDPNHMYYSYRGGEIKGRMLSYIGILPVGNAR